MLLHLHGYREDYDFIMTDNRDTDECMSYYMSVIITETIRENIR